MDIISGGALSSFVLEGIKWLVRKFWVKDMTYDFPVAFYAIMIPLLNALAPFALLALGLPVVDPILAMTAVEIVRYLVVIALGSAISFATNTGVIKPIKEYTRQIA